MKKSNSQFCAMFLCFCMILSSGHFILKADADFIEPETLNNSDVEFMELETPYSSDVTRSGFFTDVGEDITSPCAITFVSNGGTKVEPMVVEYGSLITPVPKKPVRTDYTFAGWRSDPSLNTRWNFDTDRVYSDIMLYAKWIYEEPDYNSELEPLTESTPITQEPTTPIQTEESIYDDIIISQLHENKDNIVVTITADSAEFSQEAWRELAESGKSLTISSVGGVSITLSAENIESLYSTQDETVTITLKHDPKEFFGTQNAVNADLLKLSYGITIHIGETMVTKFHEPLVISFNLEDQNLTGAQKINLTGIRFSGDGRSYSQLGGKFNGDGNFEFNTNSLSDYGVIVSDRLTKISMKVNENHYTVNGTAKTADAPPLFSDNNVVIPVRYVAEALGANVEWNGETRIVNLLLDGNEISLGVDTKANNMETSPFIYEDRAMFPLYYIGERIGANAVYNPKTDSIEIYK